MLDQLIAVLLDDLALTALDLGITELYDLAAVQTYHVVMVFFLGQFEDGVTAIEVVTHHQSRCFKLGEHTINRRQTDIFASLKQRLVHVLGTQVSIRRFLEDLQDLDSR